MTTDFTYNNKTINSTGPIKPSGKNQPLDPRTAVNLYADIESIPNPYVGMIITVLQDETNSNKMTDYKVLSLKANSLGIANSVVDQVQRYVDYLGANGQGVDINNFATKEELGLKADKTELHSHINKTVLDGITSTNVNNWNNKVDKVEGKTLTTNDYTNEEKQTVASLKATVGDTSSGLVKDVKDLKENGVSQDDINTAVNNYLIEHPIQSGATAEQVAQIEANRTAIGDSNSGLIKKVNDIENTELENLNTAIQTLETLIGLDQIVGDGNGLPSGDANVITSINRINNSIGTEELPTTAKTLKGAIAETFQNVSNGKTLIASAITGKGITTSNTDTFQTMANNIGLISSNTSSGTKDPYRQGRVLVWEDDFNGETLDLNSWDYEIEYSRNGEAQVYIAENVSVSNSNLVITAKKERHNSYSWTSGCIHSNNKREFQYGRIEAKIKMPKGVSFFPAFWMLGANFEYDYINHTELGVPWAYCGEIDIMECVTEENRSNCAMLWNVGSGILTTGKQYSPTIDPSEYNIYSAEWTEDKIEFYVNDILFYAKDITGIDWNGYNCFRQPHFLLINLAMGGSNAPAPDNTTPNEVEMLVDWVRVYSPHKYNVYPTDVTLTKTEAQMVVGDELILFANIIDGVDKNLVWKSNNTECVTVNGGKIRAVANGSATITATTRNNHVASCIVSVSDTIPVNSISLNKKSIEIGVGDSETLTVSFTPSNATNKNIIWSTSNSNATVSNGIVSGATEGECIITATSEDGSHTDTCTVNVVSASTGLVYSFNNFDVDTCISEGKIYADNDSSVYLEAKGTLTNSEGKLISNGTLFSSFDCANVLKDVFTFDITLRRVKGNWISKGLYFNCLSPNSPWEGFNAYCMNGNSLVAEFNIGGTRYINSDTSILQSEIINMRVTKDGNTINLYRNGELVHTTSVTASWSASKYLAIGGNATSTRDMLGEFEFISLSIYNIAK